MQGFRMRLALALGLPLAAGCKSAPTTEPPTTTGPITTQPAGKIADPKLCPFEHVREQVCGTVYDDGSYPKVTAPAPWDVCPTKVAQLTDFERNSIIDGWRVEEKDPSLGNFEWDLASSKSYEVNNGVREGEPRCCYQRCAPLPAIDKPRAAVPAGMKVYEACWPAPEQTAFPAPGAPRCPIALRTRLWYPYGEQDPLDDAPFVKATEGNYCCYNVASLHRCPPNTTETANGGCESPNPGGRPLRDAGGFATAPARSTTTWRVTAETVPSLSPDARARAAEAWTREAAFEHASVAAFARLSLELLAHAAPPELVDAAHVAARDEIRHARLCYGIASAFAGQPIGPGPLALADTRAPTLEELAVECFRDGCVSETIAALGVTEASRRAGTAALRETLAGIAEDETTHSELSYRILDWALSIGGPTLHARIALELTAIRDELATERPATIPCDDDDGIGILSPAAAASLRRRVLAEVVVPCTEALLARYA